MKLIWFLLVLQQCVPGVEPAAWAEPGDHAEVVQQGPETRPDPKLTPGVLCTPKDPNFQGLQYAEKVARCKRVVPLSEKVKIAYEYGGIAKKDWPKYEFDHLIPLCAGGSDDIGNLWPQPIAEAHEKDKIEDAVCAAMKAGKMKQAEAVDKIHAWFK